MTFYSIKLGLNAEISQQDLMDGLRSAGVELIQTSDGLFLKTSKTVEEIIKDVNPKIAKIHFSAG